MHSSQCEMCSQNTSCRKINSGAQKSVINNSKIYFELTDSHVFHIRHVREGIVVFHKVMHENVDIINYIDPIGELDRHLKAHMRFVAQFRENHWNHRSRKV